MSIFELINDQSLSIPVYVFVFIMGIMFGSFLNVLIYRIPKGEEFVKTSSHCMSCGHKLAWYDNIPLFSWISLKGRCRYCKEQISKQYPVIEALNGLVWLFVFFVNGVNIDSLLICAMASGLLVMGVIDFRTQEIANGFHLFFGTLALAHIALDYHNWLNYVIGMFCVSLILFIIYMISAGGAIGGGDVKLMASCGLFLGWQNVILATAIGCIVGSIIHLIRMRFFNAGRVLAMGPYLAIGIFVSSLFGDQIISLYLSLFV